MALGNNDAREGGGDAQMLFWAGLVLIYTPIVLRLFSPKSSRTECLALSMLLGGSLFMVKVLYNPTGLIPHDEMASLRQTWELFTTGHFFSANPVVQGYAGYPGLEAVTAPLAQLSRTSTYVAAMIVIGVARVTLILALFLFLERVTGSYRVAGIGIAVYVSNPSFLYFDSQFGYESLALPIGAALVLVSLRWASAPRAERRLNTRGILAAMAVLAATVVATHHLTSYSVLAFLVIWALTIEFGRRDGVFPAVPATYGADPSAPRQGPALPALFTGAAIAFWLLVVAGSVTANELGSVIAGAFESAIDLLTGQGGSKALFEAGHGETNSTVARILGVASIIPLLFVIPFGLRRTWMRRGSNAMWRALAVVAALYPITLVLRLTQAGTETSQRASEFVFVGLAFVAGLLIVERRQHAKPGWMALRQLGLAAIATVVFLGGFIVGESPVTRQPGPYLVAAESRSVSPQALAAARFADEHLPPRSRILVDRVNGVLMAAIGHLDPVIGSVKGIPVSQVFFSRRYGRKDQVVISDDAIDYIVVDRRFIERLPVSGYYYEKDEPSGGKPISREALQKFANLDGLTRIFDNGAIAIYDTAGLRSRPR
ncbi:MAG: hypothetical protein ACXWMN_02355 [Candidatus Limnocylindria bacterium]